MRARFSRIDPIPKFRRLSHRAASFRRDDRKPDLNLTASLVIQDISDNSSCCSKRKEEIIVCKIAMSHMICVYHLMLFKICDYIWINSLIPYEDGKVS